MAKASSGPKASQSAKSFPQVLYDRLTRTSAAQWDAMLRHPWFLRPISLYINGVLTVIERTRALTGLGWRMLNLPTREEIAALDHKLTALHERLDELTAQLAAPGTAKHTVRATPRPSSGAKAAVNRRTVAAVERKRTARKATPKAVAEAEPTSKAETPASTPAS